MCIRDSLFLQQLYHELGIHKICKEITGKYKFEFNLNSILSRLLYGRILFPSSKRSTYELSLIHIYPFDGTTGITSLFSISISVCTVETRIPE